MEQEFGAQVQMVLLVQAVCQILITLICTIAHLMDRSETTTTSVPGGV